MLGQFTHFSTVFVLLVNDPCGTLWQAWVVIWCMVAMGLHACGGYGEACRTTSAWMMGFVGPQKCQFWALLHLARQLLSCMQLPLCIYS